MEKSLLAIAFLSLCLPFSLHAQTIWNGSTISFSKAAGADFSQAANQDRITTTWITRGHSQGIFNIAQEPFFTHNSSPVNTEWATGSLANYASLSYQSWEDWAGGRNNIPSIVGVPAVLHLIAEDIYIGITFTSWGSGGGGAFSYSRTTSGPAIPTPVKLAGFTAVKKHNAVQLDWKTASEENTSFFSIERSADGKEYKTVGSVAAAGQSSEAVSYSFTDNMPLPSNYYRLKTIGRDGTFSYSQVISFKMEKKRSFEVYPIPASRILNIQLTAPAQIILQVVDISGRMVKCITVPEGESSFAIDIGHLLKGTYFLMAGTESRMIIKE